MFNDVLVARVKCSQKPQTFTALVTYTLIAHNALRYKGRVINGYITNWTESCTMKPSDAF